jgi:hypothetical protein
MKLAGQHWEISRGRRMLELRAAYRTNRAGTASFSHENFLRKELLNLVGAQLDFAPKNTLFNFFSFLYFLYFL